MKSNFKTKVKYTLVVEQEIELETPLPLLTEKSIKHELRKLPLEKHFANAKLKRYEFVLIDKVGQSETW